MWLLVLSRQGGYVFHSVHKDKATADQWKKCKEHDNEDCALVEITADKLEEFTEEVERFANQK